MLLDESLTATDQRAFWGPNVEERLEVSRREMGQQQPRYLMVKEFFAKRTAPLKAADAAG